MIICNRLTKIRVLFCSYHSDVFFWIIWLKAHIILYIYTFLSVLFIFYLKLTRWDVDFLIRWIVWIVLFLQTICSITFITPAAAVVFLLKVPQHILYKSFFSGFIVQSSNQLWAITVSWDRSSSAESMLTNQLLLKKDKKDLRNYRGLVDFVKVFVWGLEGPKVNRC